MDLGLNGKSVQAASVEYTLRLQLSDECFVVVESPFSIHTGGEAIYLTSEKFPAETAQPVHFIVGLTVQEATADDCGALRIRFGDGTRLDVQPDEGYEAWNVSRPDGYLVVCTPGGELAVWSAHESGGPRATPPVRENDSAR